MAAWPGGWAAVWAGISWYLAFVRLWVAFRFIVFSITFLRGTPDRQFIPHRRLIRYRRFIPMDAHRFRSRLGLAVYQLKPLGLHINMIGQA